MKLFVLMALLYTAVLIYAGFFFGMRNERLHWKTYLPAEMNQLCLDCAGIKSDVYRQRLNDSL